PWQGGFEARPGRRRLWTWVTAGGAVAALTAAIVLGSSAQSDYDGLKQKYPNGLISDPRDRSVPDSIDSTALGANVLYGVGAASALAAVLLYHYEGMTRAETERTEEPRAHIRPLAAPTCIGFSWNARF